MRILARTRPAKPTGCIRVFEPWGEVWFSLWILLIGSCCSIPQTNSNPFLFPSRPLVYGGPSGGGVEQGSAAFCDWDGAADAETLTPCVGPSERSRRRRRHLWHPSAGEHWVNECTDLHRSHMPVDHRAVQGKYWCQDGRCKQAQRAANTGCTVCKVRNHWLLQIISQRHSEM